MAFGYYVDRDTATLVRDLTGEPGLEEITVYDAEFPAETGQQFIEARVSGPDGQDRFFDLTNPRHAALSEVLHEAASENGATTKFFLVLPTP